MKKIFSPLKHSIVLFFLSGVSITNAQPYEGGRGLIYFYAGISTVDVNTKAVFEITDPNIPVTNTTLELENDLNFLSSNSLFYFKVLAGGRFQFVGSYFSLHRTGDSYLTRDFSFGDQSYTVGARVKGYFNTDYYSGTLRFSILHKAKATAGISLGGRYLRLEAGLDANSNGASFVRDGSYDVPVVVPGIHGSFYILPSLLARGSVEYFEIDLNNTKAKVTEWQISAEYYLLRYLGAGIGYGYSDLRGEGLPDNPLFLKDVNYTVKGMNFFVAFRF